MIDELNKQKAGFLDEMLQKAAHNYVQGPYRKEVCKKIQAVICRKGRAIDLGQETENLDNFANITRSADLTKPILQGTVKGKRKDVDGRSRKTILRCGQGWPAQLGQLKTGQDGKRS